MQIINKKMPQRSSVPYVLGVVVHVGTTLWLLARQNNLATILFKFGNDSRFKIPLSSIVKVWHSTKIRNPHCPPCPPGKH